MTEEALVSSTHLSERDVRYVRSEIMEGSLEESDLLVYGLYDMLRKMHFDTQGVTAMLRHYRDPLRRIGMEYEESLNAGVKESVLIMLHIIDNQWVTIDGCDEVFDIKELAEVQQCPRPFVGLFVVLPELFWRLRRATRRHLVGHSSDSAETVPSGG